MNRVTDPADALRDRRSQLDIVREQLENTGRCDAHQMLMAHGITRCAAIILRLRQAGMDIRTLPLERGKMATYELVRRPPAAQRALWEELR